MSVKVKMIPGWSSKIQKELNAGLLELTTEVHRRSVVLAPVDSRALVNSGVIEPVTGGYQVKYGSSKVPYARRRHFENKKNPQTKGYLAKAGDSVSRGDQGKYWRGKI